MMTRNENLKTYSIKEIPHYHIYGRTDKTQNLLPLFWNGSGIEVNVTGSELWIDLDVDCSFHEPWIATELNGAFMSRQMLLPGSYSICLFRSMTFGVPKTMKFFRELQAMSEDDDCHVFVRGFRCDGEFLPVKEHKYKIEFIGDSITSGEGTYGALPDTDWLAMYMSSSENYATYTAKALDADYRLISQGGWGVYCGWDNDVRHNIPSCYEKICGLGFGEVNESVGAQKDYDFASWKPDVIVVNLGTNDASAFNQPPFTIPETGETFKQHKNPDGSFVEEDRERFENAVYNFLKMLRKDNPGAHIVWTYGMLGYDLNLLITDAMNRYQKDTGDHNTAFINLPNTTSETVGAHTHPGVKSHERAARILIEYLQTVLH